MMNLPPTQTLPQQLQMLQLSQLPQMPGMPQLPGMQQMPQVPGMAQLPQLLQYPQLPGASPSAQGPPPLIVYNMGQGAPGVPPYNVLEVADKKVQDEKHKQLAEEQSKLREDIIEEQSELKQGMLCVNLVGMVFAMAALVMLIVAFATSEWIIYNVTYPTNPLLLTNGDDNYICSLDATIQGTQTCSMFFTRHRGLFYTYYNNPAFFTSAYSPEMYFGNNVWEQGYGLPGTPLNQRTVCELDVSANRTGVFTSLVVRQSLLRCHWIAMLLAILLFLFVGIMSLASFFKGRICAANSASILSVFGLLMAILAMACFHGYIYMESSLLTCPPFIGILSKAIFSKLKNATTQSYGYSLYVGWGSVAAALIATISLCIFSCFRNEISSKITNAKKRLFRINKLNAKEQALREKEAKKLAKEKVRMAQKDLENKKHQAQNVADATEMEVIQRKIEEDRKMLMAEEQRLARLRNVLNNSPPPSPGPIIKSPVFNSPSPYVYPQSVMPTMAPPAQMLAPPHAQVPAHMPPAGHGPPMQPAPGYTPAPIIDPSDPYTLHLPTGTKPPPYSF